MGANSVIFLFFRVLILSTLKNTGTSLLTKGYFIVIQVCIFIFCPHNSGKKIRHIQAPISNGQGSDAARRGIGAFQC